MSDADWDREYALAGEIEQEIRDLCLNKGIKCPDIKNFTRSWELRLMLKEIEKEGIN